jgi:small subunit ribosomal protein S16
LVKHQFANPASFLRFKRLAPQRGTKEKTKLMVKIRLRRTGNKGRPFYRVVVAPSTAGRNGKFVETIGTYDPVAKPKLIKINEERAIYWLLQGAQPSETTAYLLNKVGILGKFFEQRPNAKNNFKYLDKTTSVTSVASVLDMPAADEKVEVENVEKVEEEAPATEETTEEA